MYKLYGIYDELRKNRASARLAGALNFKEGIFY